MSWIAIIHLGNFFLFFIQSLCSLSEETSSVFKMKVLSHSSSNQQCFKIANIDRPEADLLEEVAIKI